MSESEEQEPKAKKEHCIADDKYLCAFFDAADAIPPYIRNKVTNIRHILNAVESFRDRVDNEIKVKASTGAYDPEGHEKAVAEAEARNKKDAADAKKKASKKTDKEGDE
jgi:hypothetical protein